MEEKRGRGRPKKRKISERPIDKNQEQIAAVRSLFRKIQQALPALEYRIRDFTQEDLERFTGDIIRYRAHLIDINNYAYMVLGLFSDLIDFYIKPVLYRWTVNTKVKYGFDQNTQNPDEFHKDFVAYSCKLNQLGLEREIHRILLRMFLEDAVFGYWVEDNSSSTIFYLRSEWCVLKEKVNGNWSYMLNTPRISQREQEILPPELAALVKKHRNLGGDAALAPVPFERQVCYKYNDHTSTIFPPFTHVLLLIIDLMKAKQLALSQAEQDVVNLIQMLIPSRTDEDDHILFTDPIIEKYSVGLQELTSEYNAILPTPFDLSVLNTKNKNVDLNVVRDAMEAYHNETGIPRFGGSNTASELLKSLEFAASKVYIVLDQISSAINLKMKFDGFVHEHYEFEYEILHMTQFNKNTVLENMLKQSQAGGINKIALEAARGNNPSKLIGQFYAENVVYRNMFESLLVPPSSHTQSSTGGRPEEDEENLSPSGVQTREKETNVREEVYEKMTSEEAPEVKGRKMICVRNKDVAERLVGMNFKYMTQHLQSDEVVYTFLETEELRKELMNKRKYSKKDWFYDTKLRF